MESVWSYLGPRDKGCWVPAGRDESVALVLASGTIANSALGPYQYCQLLEHVVA